MEKYNDQSWLGHQQLVDDNVDMSLVIRLAALFGKPAPTPHSALPPLWHWAFFQAPCSETKLGEDGHPDDDGFLPPRNGRQRMWASGDVAFHHPLQIGNPARRISTLEDIEKKNGSNGELTFLRVRHEYFQLGPDGRMSGKTPAISERQVLVYRSPAPAKTQGGSNPDNAQWQRRIEPTSVTLFRYSAATFNGHRIHYDTPYATEREGYPGLVVHGPLITTWMLDAFIDANPQAQLRRLRYRGNRPLFSPTPFEVAGRIDAAGQASLWAADDQGLAHQATLEFEA